MMESISIVTPSYNQSAYLERTIQSVLDQNYPHLEYIIIDGGSTDGSVDIIRKYEKHLAYWVSEKDRGQTHALNKGFMRATGKIVGWVNSDDMYCPGSFQKAADAFAQNPELGLVYGDLLIVDKDDKILRPLKSPYWWPAHVMLGMTLQPAAFWKRSLFEQFGLLDERLRFAMDYEFFCRAGKDIASKYLPVNIVCFRSHPDQKTETLQKVCMEETSRIRQQYARAACGIFPERIFLGICNLHKGAWHLYHGDFAYLRRRIHQGAKKVFAQNQKWVEH